MRRSQLYVPANSEKMIRKSVVLPADSVILDLEDGVPSSEKEKARQLVSSLLRELDWGGREICLRINGFGSLWGVADLLALRSEKFDAVVVPKAEGDLSFIKAATGKNVIPLVETARGLEGIDMVVRSEGVVAVSYGAADLAGSLGGSMGAYESNNSVRTRIATAARAYGVEPIDRVSFDLEKLDSFRSDAADAKGLGFTGKQVIHPSQITIANEVFAPSREEEDWSRKIVASYEEAIKAGRGAIVVDGRLVDAVHYRMAKRILGASG